MLMRSANSLQQVPVLRSAGLERAGASDLDGRCVLDTGPLSAVRITIFVGESSFADGGDYSGTCWNILLNALEGMQDRCLSA